MIPRVVHQTWKTTDRRAWSRRQRRWVGSWQKASGWAHQLHGDDDCARLIDECYPDLSGRFAALRAVEKADVWRVAYLLAHGGCYADIDTICRTPIDTWIDAADELVIPLMADFVDQYPGWQPRHTLHSGGVFDPASDWRDNLVLFGNFFIAARPGHPLLADVMRRIATNIDDPFFAADDEGLICKKTGPGALTDAIEAHLVAHGTSLLEVGRRLRHQSAVRVGGVRLLDHGSAQGRHLDHAGMRTWQPRHGVDGLRQRVREALI
jgi:hypothetical protein